MKYSYRSYLHAVVPEGVHHIDTEEARVYAVVLWVEIN